MKKHSVFKSVLALFTAVTLLCGMVVPSAAADVTAETAGYSLSRVQKADLGTAASISQYRSNTSADAFTVASKEELCTLSELVGSGVTFAGKTVYLTSDIDMSGVADFTPIGFASYAASDWSTIKTAPANAFAGTFDGQRHTIDGLVIDGKNMTGGASYTIGLFGAVNGATVKNVILGENCSFTGASQEDFTGAVIGIAYGTNTVSNCFNRATVSTGMYAGAFVGRVIYNTTVEYCTNLGDISDATYSGGMAGASAAGKFLYCRNMGAISAKRNPNTSGGAAGGIVGHVNDVAEAITGCINNGAVSGEWGSGGIIGYIQNDMEPASFTNCRSYGTAGLAGIVANASYTIPASNVNSATGTDASLTERMLGVAIQYSASASSVSAKTDLRLISSVDSLSYQKVWFEVTFGKLDGTALTADKSFSSPEITVVYDAIRTSAGQTVTNYEPWEVFSPNSRYFFTFTIDEIESDYFAMPIRVQACAMTEEGQTVKGAEIQFRLDEKMSSENIVATGIVGRETLYDNQYQAWPTVCKDENGVLYAVCSNRLKHIDPFGKNCLYKSTDGGITWDAGTVINDTPYFDDRDSGIVYLGGGKMVMSYFNHKAANYVMNLNSDGTVKADYTVGSAFYKEWHQWCDWQEIANWGVSPSDEKYNEILQKIEDTKAYLLSVASGEIADKRGSYLRVSNDYGATWSESFKVEISAPHGPTLMQDGQTLLYVGKESYSGLAGFHAIQYSFTDASGNVLTQADIQNPNKQITGIKKGNASQLPLPEGMTVSQCWEPHGIQLQDGTVLAAMRVQPTSNTLHLEVYLTRGTVQQNGSIEWSTPVHIAEGQIGAPAHLLQASDGTLIVTYGRRVEPTGILARVSQDGGLTWGKEIVLSRPANTADDDLGYSATVELSNKNGELTFLTVYYQHYNGEKMPSILYTAWKIPAKVTQ